MNITYQDLEVIANVKGILDYNRFPHLMKYKARIDALQTDPIQEAFRDDPAKSVYVGSNGLRITKQGEEASRKAEPFLREYLNLISEIRRDNPDKQYSPLDSYLFAVQTHLRNSLSDFGDALDPLKTETGALQHTLLSSIRRVPAKWELERTPNSELTARTFEQLAEAAHVLGYKQETRRQLSINPSFTDDQGYQTGYSNSIRLAAESAGKMSAAEKHTTIDTMMHLTGIDQMAPPKPAEFKTRFTSALHGTSDAARSEGERLLAAQRDNIPPEISTFLREVWTSINRAKHEAGVLRPEHTAGTAAEILQEMNEVEEICRDTLQNGFDDDDERSEFVEDMTKRVSALGRRIEHYNTTDYITDMDGASGIEQQKLQAGKQLMDTISGNFLSDQGLMKRAEQISAERKVQQTVYGKGLTERMSSFYEMMLDTGSGYWRHKNSKEYEDMLKSIEKTLELSKRTDELSDVEQMALQTNLKEVENACKLYLADKTSKRSSETGKDRFAGALGILEMLNFEEADKIRQKASAAQKKQISFDELTGRAQEQAVKHQRQRAERKRQAERANAPQT